jgi:protein-S-isoprenylcysteine O-methyltransferase Ste14
VDWLLAGGLLAEALLLLSLLVSILRPGLRLWPPADGSTLAFAWMWGLTVAACTTGLLLAILDYGGWVLDHPAWILAGATALALGAGLADWGVRTLGRRTSSGRGGEFSAGGPYRWTRNPQYLGDILMALGVVLVADSWRVAAVGAGGALCLLLAPLAEERWLVERYGDAYESYRRRVPRLPGLPR